MMFKALCRFRHSNYRVLVPFHICRMNHAFQVLDCLDSKAVSMVFIWIKDNLRQTRRSCTIFAVNPIFVEDDWFNLLLNSSPLCWYRNSWTINVAWWILWWVEWYEWTTLDRMEIGREDNGKSSLFTRLQSHSINGIASCIPHDSTIFPPPRLLLLNS